jgi:signal transduction histidine kinase
MQELDQKTRLKLELLYATCKNLPIVVYTTDKNNVCTHADGKEEIMLADMHTNQMIGKNIEEIFPDKQSIITVHESALKGYHGSYEWFFDNTAIQVFVRPFIESDKTITGTIAVGIDVSDSRSFEKQLIDSRQKAEKALRVKSEFLNVMSHEIRTPLNAIIGISHLLLEDKPNQSQLENLEILKYSAENLLSLINDVLDYGKLESGKVTLDLRPVRLKQLVDSSIKALEVKAREKGLLLKCIYDQDLPEGIITDSTRLNQVINNSSFKCCKIYRKRLCNSSITL